jgi:hypothetical protein
LNPAVTRPASASATVAKIALVSRFSVAAIWFYQGLVPKLMGPHADELAMSAAFGIPQQLQRLGSISAGALEIAFAICIAVAARAVWPHALSALGCIVLLAFVAVFSPAYLGAAFNPVSLNLALFVLSWITIMCVRFVRASALAEQQTAIRGERHAEAA